GEDSQPRRLSPAGRRGVPTGRRSSLPPLKLQGMVSVQVLAMPTIGRARLASPKPIAFRYERAGARSRPSLARNRGCPGSLSEAVERRAGEKRRRVREPPVRVHVAWRHGARDGRPGHLRVLGGLLAERGA